VTLGVGQTFNVTLPAEYDPAVSSDGDVVRTSVAGGYPTGRTMRATFRAAQRGRADVTSETDYPCLHTTPRCAVAQRTWVVHVIVQ
jgi:hypothetical protein